MHKDCKEAMLKVMKLKARLLNRLEDDFEWNTKELRKKFKKLSDIENKINCQTYEFDLKYNMHTGWGVFEFNNK